MGIFLKIIAPELLHIKNMTIRDKINFSLFLFLFIPFPVYSQNLNNMPKDKATAADSTKNGTMVYQISPDIDFVYSKPRRFQYIKYGPKDLFIYGKNTFQKKNIARISAMAAATALLVAADQSIADESQKLGRKIHLSRYDRTRTMISIKGFPVFRGPTDLGSALYFIGDGWMDVFIFSSFMGYGMIRNDNRALQTAAQIGEGLIAAGLTVQILKHIAGRESPCVATVPRGKWRLFPSPIDFQKNVAKYDAFPSGHLATSVMVFTVISENYPEYKFIRPLGYTLLTLLSFQMMNNGVHWISDYPMAIAIGYSLGKIAANRGRTLINKSDSIQSSDCGQANSFSVLPIYYGRCGMGLALNYKFK